MVGARPDVPFSSSSVLLTAISVTTGSTAISRTRIDLMAIRRVYRKRRKGPRERQDDHPIATRSLRLACDLHPSRSEL
jgi:hypothetical protein